MNQTPDVSDPIDNEWLLEAFESQWLASLESDPDETLDTLPPSIEVYFRRACESGFDPTESLIELVRLDMEYRLLVAAQRRPMNSAPWLPWSVEQYLEAFPDLPLKVDWIADEWRLRNRRGETVDAADWLRRFPPSAFATESDHQQFTQRLNQFVRQQGSVSPNQSATRGAAGDSTSHMTKRRSLSEAASPSDRSPPPFPAELDSWSLLRPRFRQEKVLGQGSFGTVWRAFDEQLNRWVAVKTLRPALAGDTAQRQSLIEEARSAASLDHPDLLTIHDVLVDQHQVHVVMQWVDGTPLDQWWSKSFPGPPELESDIALARLIARISRAVHHAHLAGLIHCDLKPANILIDNTGKPTVLDFGLAVRRSDQEDLSGRIVGTPAYMSPEQTWGDTHHLDGRTDVWSLGVIFYRLLTGKPPFEATGVDRLFEAIQSRPLTPCRQIRDNTPELLCKICERCLSKRTEARYASAAELADHLERFIETAAPPADEIGSGSSSSGSRSVSGLLHPPGTVAGLPWAAPELVGRQEIIQQVTADLFSSATADETKPARRLITLTGVGGVGKTQTAVAIARQFTQQSAKQPVPVEAAWVELASVEDADGLASSVLTVLGASPSQQSSAQEHLVRTLAVRGPLLLVLDNVEQVVEPVSQQIATWLAASPSLRILVTSQVPLRISGESVRMLSALQTNPTDDRGSGTSATQPPADRLEHGPKVEDDSIEALALFVRRARDVRPDLVLTSDQRADALEICRLVDGNPLAIELAAARLGVLSIADLRDRLGESFSVLKSHRTDRPDRHKTLFDVVRWSFELLDADTRGCMLDLAAWPAPVPMDLAEKLLEHRVDDPLVTLEELASRQLIQCNDHGGVTMVGPPMTVHRFASDSLTQTAKFDLARRWIEAVAGHQIFAPWLDQPGDEVATLADDGVGWGGRNGYVATNLLSACQWQLDGGASIASLVRAVMMADQLAGDQWDSSVRISRLEPLLQYAEGLDQIRLGLRLSDAKRLAGQTGMAEMICRQTARQIELRLSRTGDPSDQPRSVDENEDGVLRQLDVRACRLLATILFRHGETDAAIEQLQAALQRLKATDSSIQPDLADHVDLSDSFDLTPGFTSERGHHSARYSMTIVSRATVDVLLELTEIYRRAGKNSLALETLTQAEQQLQKWRSTDGSPTINFLQSNQQERRSGSQQEPGPDIHAAFPSSQGSARRTPATSEWDSRMTRVQIQRGKIALQQGRIEEAFDTFDQVVDRCRSTRDHRDWQQALLGRAAAAAEKGDFDSAGQDYDRCEKISRRLGDLPTLAQSINNRALAYDDAGDSQRCCEVLQHALQIYRQLDDSVGIAIAQSAYAAALLQLGRPAEACQLLLSDEVQSAIPKGSIHDAILRGDLGTALHHLGRFDEAADSLRQALQLLDRLGIATSAERLLYTIQWSEVLEKLGAPNAVDIRKQADEFVASWPRRHRDRQRVADALSRHNRRQ